MIVPMRPERRSVFEAKLKKRKWQTLDDKGLTWGHPELKFSWPFGDALRLEEEVDSGHLQAREILGVKLKGISET